MNVGAASLADRFGTPLYVYDLDDVARAVDQLRAALPAPHVLLYSAKANPHPAVIARVHAAGCELEISSTGELAAVVAAGVPLSTCLYTGPAKSVREIETAIASGVGRFSVDSPAELAKVGDVACTLDRPVTCLLRVNPSEPVLGGGLTMGGRSSPFGADEHWILADRAAFGGSEHARVVGVHLYTATNVSDPERLAASLEASALAAQRLGDAGIPLEVIDIGGGFPAPFAAPGPPIDVGLLRHRLEPVLDRSHPGWRDGRPTIAFEAGRYLVAGAGLLVASVVDVKTSMGQRYVLLDSGINHLGGLSGLGRVPPLHAEPASPTPAGGPSSVVGPLCTPVDRWHPKASLGAVVPGDRVVVPNVGAYGLTASLVAFLGHPVTQEVVIEGGEVVDRSQLRLEREPLQRDIAAPGDGRRQPQVT